MTHLPPPLLLLLAISTLLLDRGPPSFIARVDAIDVASLGSLVAGDGRTGWRRTRTGSLAGHHDPGVDDVGGGMGGDAASKYVAAASCSSSDSSSASTRHDPDDDRPSFPVYHHHATDNVDNGMSRDDDTYVEYMNGCRAKYDTMVHRGCDNGEYDRMEMNARQPPNMINYTSTGYKKVRAPAMLMTHLTRIWNGRDADDVIRMADESWPPGNSYVNHWSSPTKMLDMTHSTSRRVVWDTSREALDSWTGVDLSPSSLYGIRVYTNGSILAPHVDRVPLVISAVINVAQDVDEPWPLVVHGHDGRYHNVTMDVGDMILYEGHSVLHGRPYPLKGRYYAVSFSDIYV